VWHMKRVQKCILLLMCVHFLFLGPQFGPVCSHFLSLVELIDRQFSIISDWSIEGRSMSVTGLGPEGCTLPGSRVVARVVVDDLPGSPVPSHTCLRCPLICSHLQANDTFALIQLFI